MSNRGTQKVRVLSEEETSTKITEMFQLNRDHSQESDQRDEIATVKQKQSQNDNSFGSVFREFSNSNNITSDCSVTSNKP